MLSVVMDLCTDQRGERGLAVRTEETGVANGPSETIFVSFFTTARVDCCCVGFRGALLYNAWGRGGGRGGGDVNEAFIKKMLIFDEETFNSPQLYV